jgi:hypothetical protein
MRLKPSGFSIDAGMNLTDRAIGKERLYFACEKDMNFGKEVQTVIN